MDAFLKKICHAHEVLPLSNERLKSLTIDKGSSAYAINLYDVDGLKEQYFAEISGRDSNPARLHLRISLFDHEFGLFFGKTLSTVNKNYRGQNTLSFNKNVFFHSSMDREKILLVVELVASWKYNVDDDGNDDDEDADNFHVSCGWGACLAFRSTVCNTEFGTSRKSSVQISRVNLYNGTPRSLFFIRDFSAFQKDHTPTRVSVSLSAQFHRGMDGFVHLMQENVFFSDIQDVPGLRDSGSSLKRPEPCVPLRSSLEKMEIRLLPSLEEFDETFLRLIREDLLSRPGGVGPPEDVSIGRRTLRVGVHNGRTFVGPLEDIQMTLNSETLKRRLSVKNQKIQTSQKRNVLSVAAALLQGSKMIGEELLVHNTQVEVEGMMKDPSFHFVFGLVYEVLLPRPAEGEEAIKSRLSIQPVTEVLVRWGVLTEVESGRHGVRLFGGPAPNPFASLVYSARPPSHNENASSNVKEEQTEVLNLTLQMTEGSLQFSQADYTTSVDEPSATTERKISRASAMSEARRRRSKMKAVKEEEEEEEEEEGEEEEEATGLDEVTNGTVKARRMSLKASPSDAMSTVGKASSSRVSDLAELPYSSVRVPILPAFPTGKRDLIGARLSRASFARLAAFNFPVVLAADGSPAEVVDTCDRIGRMLLEKEYEDQLKVNEITLQFMAFIREPTTDGFDAIDPPSHLFFTFQFYRFDQITSERLFLELVDKDALQGQQELLHVLRRLDVNHTPMDGPPGYQVKYVVNSSTIGQAEGHEFYKYLNEQMLHVDVWDGDSLFHIGECFLDLKSLLRQGRNSLQSTLELDVLHTEYLESEMVVTDAVVSREAVAMPIEVSTSRRGKLLMRVGNVGRKMTTSVGTSDGTLRRRKVESDIFRQMNTAQKRRANKLTDMSYELVQMMLERKCLPCDISTTSPASTVEGRGAERTRKLQRLEALKKKMMISAEQERDEPEKFPVASLRLETESRQRDLKTVEAYRENYKPDCIRSILNGHITTDLVLKTSLGTTSFFEFPLQNPHNVEALVEIEWEDPDLSVVTDASEWRHFKTLNGITTPLEEGMFRAPPPSPSHPYSSCNGLSRGSKVIELFLRAKESVRVPFKFLTFGHLLETGGVDFVRNSMIISKKMNNDSNDGNEGEDGDVVDSDGIEGIKEGSLERRLEMGHMDHSRCSRHAKVHFRIKKDGTLLAILSLTIVQQPHIVDQIFRLCQPEQTFLKKSFRLPQWPQLTGSQNSASGNQIYVRCSDENVICTSSSVKPGNPVDIFIKVACGSSPQVKNFYVAIYTDPRLSKPIKIWQVHIKVMQRVDVAAVQGQTVRFSLMIRGSLSSRLVRCHASHPRQMSISPDEPFMLLAGNLHQVGVGIRPAKVGVSGMFINVVDVESSQLVTSWLVHVITQEPIVSRQFEISMAVGGPGENKRILFVNPYAYKKTFYLHTSHKDLLLFKENKLELSPTQKYHIGMKFVPATVPGQANILVFINDEEDKNEETFVVRVKYRRS